MSFKLLGGGSDLNGVVSDMNQNILELKGREVTEVFKDDTGVRRVLSGKRGDDYGLFVSKPTFDVFTAADDELIFNSGQNVFKIVQSGTIESPALSIADPGAQYASDDAITSLEHGLGYKPAVIGYLDNLGVYYQLPFYFPRGTGTSAAIAWPFLQISVDDTNVNLNFNVTVFDQSWSSTVGDFTVKYYLLQETAN